MFEPQPLIRRLAAACVLPLALAACATPNAGPPPPPPPSGAVATGATILGRTAFETDTAKGSCAGLSVALMADSPRFRRRAEALYGSLIHASQSVAAVKARSAALGPEDATAPVQTAQCNGRGEFILNGVAGGSYFLIAHVWIARQGQGRADHVILQRISLRDGQTKDVQVTP
jgi:hypothetical protein